MKIPIKNLYYLFCYAWARFPQGGSVEVGVEESPDLPNLFGRLLVRGVNQLLRRGMDASRREDGWILTTASSVNPGREVRLLVSLTS